MWGKAVTAALTDQPSTANALQQEAALLEAFGVRRKEADDG